MAAHGQSMEMESLGRQDGDYESQRENGNGLSLSRRGDGEGERGDSSQHFSNINGGLPPIGSRNAKWWYSTFHNVTAMVGAGVLGLPSAMAFLGWGAGTIVLTASWVITLFTLWQLVEMHEKVPAKFPKMLADHGMTPRSRLDQYHELGQAAFGKKKGLWIILPPQIIVQVGLDIVYIVTGGQCLMKFFQLVKCPDSAIPNNEGSGCSTSNCAGIGLTVWIIIFAAPQFLLSQLPNLGSISGLSLAAAVMSVGYSTIAWSDAIHQRRGHGDYTFPEYITKCVPSRTLETFASPAPSPASGNFEHLNHARLAFGVMRALGVVAFAYGGHNVVLEIQATLPSFPNKPSKMPMWKGVMAAYAIVGFCYFPVAMVGYWAYGNSVYDNILFSLSEPKALIAAANLMVVIHVLGSYQLYAMPIFDILETTITIKFGFRRSRRLRLITRCSYVFLTAFIAITFPFFGDLLGFLGGVAFAPTTYFLPCIIWLKIFKPSRFSLTWIVNWVCIILGVMLMIVSTLGGLFYIVLHASQYNNFYQ